MGLNVKAAILVCAGFISGLCWLVSQVALPLTTPSAAAGQPLLAGMTNASAGSGAVAAGPGGYAGGTPKFTRNNPFDSRQAGGGPGAERLEAAPVPPMDRARPAALPPLARPTAGGIVTADAGLDGPAAWDCEAARQPVSAESEVAPPKVEVARGGDPEPRPGAAREDAGKPVASSKYKVQKGDTLARIAVRQCGSSDARVVQLLLAANPKLAKRPNKVMLGEELIIPEPAAIERVRRGEKVEVAHADGRPAPVKAAQERASLRSGKQSKVAVGDPVAASKTDGNRSSARTAQAAPRAAARGAGTGSRETPPARWYTIRASDSLKSIAERFLNDGRRWREIAELNGMQQPNKIVAGKRIRLPDSAQTDNG